MLKPSKISKCRVCKSKKLSYVGGLGKLAISSFTDTPQDGKKWPLELVWCKKCTLLQLAHNPPQNELYKRFYWYKSGLNQVIIDDLKDIVNQAIRLIRPKAGDTFLDIGANDGTLLSFVPQNLWRVAVEPAENLALDVLRNCDGLFPEFWEDVKTKFKAKIITAIGMFYDLVDPNKFIKKVSLSLHPDGIFIAQLMTLEPMLKYNDIGNICHEHIEYYTYKSLVHLYERNGLEIFKVERNRINGGSYRLYARHYRRGSIGIRENITQEKIKTFFKKIEENKKKTVSFIKSKKGVCGYGASTKGNTVLQYYGLTPQDLICIAEKNKEKWDKYTVGSKIAIFPEDEARKMCNYFFILPWGFAQEFIKKERSLGYKGKFIISTPTFKII